MLANELSMDGAGELLKGIDIPPCPAVALNLMKEARRDDADSRKIVSLISGDVGLAAGMIKVANSPVFALARKVANVQQAVTVLGLKNIMQIVAGLSLRNSFASAKISLERFWERSNYHAIVAERVARRVPGLSANDAYTYGLFHECGVPILMLKFPTYVETLAKANKGLNSTRIEEELNGTNHAVAGCMLAKTWGLPVNIYQSIRYHHDVSVLTDEIAGVGSDVPGLVAVGLLAEHIVAQFQNCPDDSNWLECGEQALVRLGVDAEELQDMRADICDELEQMKEIRH